MERFIMTGTYLVVIIEHDLFQPKTSTFSTGALIWVHFKTVRYFSQPIFRLFSYLTNALHNLVIELCIAPVLFQTIYSYIITLRTVLYLLNYRLFAKMQKIHFIARESSHYFGQINNIPYEKRGTSKKIFSTFILTY